MSPKGRHCRASVHRNSIPIEKRRRLQNSIHTDRRRLTSCKRLCQQTSSSINFKNIATYWFGMWAGYIQSRPKKLSNTQQDEQDETRNVNHSKHPN